MKAPSSVAVLLLALTACAKKQESPLSAAAQAAAKPAPISIRTAAAEARSIRKSIDITGTLTPDETTTVSCEVAGRVAEIRYDFGQPVRKGAVVAQIDRTEFAIQLDRVKASLAQALARVGLDASQEDATPKDTPAIRSARAQYEDALHKYDNAKKLVESGDIARERFVEIENLVNARKAALEGQQDELHTQLANIMVVRAEKRLAEKRLGDTTVRAPFDGIVSVKHVSPGQYIKDNAPILTLVKTYPLRLRLDVPEVAAAMIVPGQVLTFTSEALPGQEFRASVTRLDPALDLRGRALHAEARLNSAHPGLRPGMFVQVKLALSQGTGIVTVPKTALYQVAGLAKVFAVRDGHAREIRVSPGETGPDWIEVGGGLLRPGEAVAISNLQNLTDNAEVSMAR